MTFSDKMNQLYELRDQIDKMVSDLNRDLLKSIEDANNADANIVSENPSVVIVPLPKVMATPGHILSPDYYVPKCQVDAVRRRLNNCTTPEKICSAVADMLETKRVRMGSTGSDIVHLNETTLSVLENSELGQFVKNQQRKEE